MKLNEGQRPFVDKIATETREYIQKIAEIYPPLNAKRWNWPSAKDADIGKVGLKLDVGPTTPREGL